MTADQTMLAIRNRTWDTTPRTRRAPQQGLALIAAAGILAACSGPPETGTAAARPPVATSSTTPQGEPMAGMVMPEAGKTAAGPTATQAMVCGGEIKATVKQVLTLSATPSPTSTFADGKFTCVYDLPMGPMRLSVQHSSSDAAALTYLKTRATTVSAREPLIGLTEHAYGTSTGIVLVLKDNETLEVDTTALPKVFGDQQQQRTDLAYEIASDVLGCWTGHD